MNELNTENLPYSIDAEQALLGALIKDRTVIAKVIGTTTAEHFYVPVHSKLYALFQHLFNTNAEYDLVTLIDTAVQNKVFDSMEDARAYLLKLNETALTISGAEQYAAIIAEKHMMRSLCVACAEIYGKASGNTDAPSDVLDFAEQKIYELRDRREIKGLVQINKPIMEKYQELCSLRTNPDLKRDNSVSSSFRELDHYIFGLNNSDLIVLAARPGMGKTSFALIAWRCSPKR